MVLLTGPLMVVLLLVLIAFGSRGRAGTMVLLTGPLMVVLLLVLIALGSRGLGGIKGRTNKFWFD